MMNVKEMSKQELNARVDELSKILDMGISDKWDDAYTEYMTINDELDRRYREENQAAFNAYYNKYIKGKTFEEIGPETFSFYSDWHKDMYGYRPRLNKGEIA